MSQRVTWGSIKDIVGQPVGLDSCNKNLLPMVNEGISILWNAGDWVGKNQVYKIRVTADCHHNKCITWPRQVETIEAINLCNRPIGVRTQYFEFQNNAVGEIGRGNPGGYPGYRHRNSVPLLGDRSEVVVNQEIIPGGKRLRVYTERIETTGRILLLGYDDNGNWIRTQPIGGQWTDGEYLTLSNSPATTLNNFSQITGVQFDTTPRNGNTYLYSVDQNNVEMQLASYDYAVDVPVFRRSILGNVPSYQTDDGEWTGAFVSALVKTRFMPVIFDTDYPQIGNVAALKLILQYIYKRDNDKIQDAEMYRQDAIQILNDELKQYNGQGSTKTIQFLPRHLWGANSNLS